MATASPQSTSQSTVEEGVAEIWRSILDPPAGEPSTTFFELGGQSISAMRLVAAIEEDLGISIDLDDLLEDPDLPALVELVLARGREVPQA
jgi:acyl carrier protein